VASDAAEELAELVATGLLHLVAEEVGRHFVRFVDDDEVPVGLRELRLHVVVARQLVEASDDEVLVRPRNVRR
jgi:hypothetical protein